MIIITVIWFQATLKVPSGKRYLFVPKNLFLWDAYLRLRSPDGTTVITNSADNHLRSYVLYVALGLETIDCQFCCY